MVKLIVQIPCLNEAETLPGTVADIPRQIDGIDRVEILVIDDGSTDGTADVARKIGVDHIVRSKKNRGLARSFRTGLEACLKLGADIIVNTDGDNQYVGADIAKLVQPILKGEADMVVGDRQTHNVSHFSPMKKLLQKLGSFAVRTLSGASVPDAVSGFRAMSRELAMNLNVLSSFSYTIETLIQAGKKDFKIVAVPVGTNAETRPSRLFRSIPRFIERSLTTMVRTYATYQPLRVFFYLGVLLLAVGMMPILRFLYFYVTEDGASGHLQSLTIGGAILVLGGIVLLIGIVADLISVNRQLLELTLHKTRRLELMMDELSNRSPAAPKVTESAGRIESKSA